jgi:tetratricopeptide (TPR) repeat protein
VRLHRKIAEALEQLYGSNPEPHLSELAYHFFEAALGGGDVDKAITWTARAGERAAQQLAYEEAASHYEHALQALDLRETSDEVRRSELLLALGEAQNAAGDSDKAKTTFLVAAELARKIGIPRHLARAALGYGGAWFFMLEIGKFNSVLVHLLDEALEALGSEESTLRARIAARLATELYFSEANERREALSRKAVEIARQEGDHAALASALMARLIATWGPDNTEERLSLATEASRLAEQAQDHELVLVSRWLRALALLEMGEIQAVDLELDVLSELAEKYRHPTFRWVVAMARTSRAMFDGRLSEVEAFAHGALVLGQRPQPQNSLLAFGVQMALLRREQARPQEVDSVLRNMADQYPGIPAFRWAVVFVSAELERHSETQSEFNRLATNGFADIPRDVFWLSSVVIAAEVCAYLDDSRCAAQLYELLEPHAGRNAAASFGSVCFGSAARSLGMMAATMHRFDEAEVHFAVAALHNARMGARPWVAYTKYGHARMLIARSGPGDRERALELLESALTSARELGMATLARRLQELHEGLRPADAVASGAQRGLASNDASQAATSSARVEAIDTDASFRREGDYWTISFRGEVCRLKNAKGLHYLAQLLRHPGRDFHAIELVAEGPDGDRPAAPGAAPQEMTQPQLERQGMHSGGLGDAGEFLDPQAKAEYKRRLRDLDQELEEARTSGNGDLASRIEEEIEFLARELAGAVGLSGRDRRAGSPSERARLNVTRAVKVVLQKLDESSPSLSKHLAHAVKTGTFCSYAPDPTSPIAWRF